jgi:hypothetical protein
MSLKKACGQSMALESDDPESSDLMHPWWIHTMMASLEGGV